MNTAKLYTLLTENEDAFKKNGNYVTYQVYDEILGMVKEEIAKEAEKAAGRKPNIRNAAKKFLSKDDTRPSLQKANIQEVNGTTYYAYIDGFKMCWSPIDFGFGVTDNPINWKAIIDVRFNDVLPITTELKTELKEFIKTHPKSGRGSWSRRDPFRIVYPNGNYIDFNPDYLQACIDFTEATELITDFDGHGNNPVLFHGKEDRHALCLPVRR